MKKIAAGLIALSSVTNSALSTDLEEGFSVQKSHRQCVDSFLEELESRDAPKSALLKRYIQGDIEEEEMAGWDLYAQWRNKI